MNRRSFMVASLFAGPTLLVAREVSQSTLREAHFNLYDGIMHMRSRPSMIIVFDPATTKYERGKSYQCERTLDSDGTVETNSYVVTWIQDARKNATVGMRYIAGGF